MTVVTASKSIIGASLMRCL